MDSKLLILQVNRAKYQKPPHLLFICCTGVYLISKKHLYITEEKLENEYLVMGWGRTNNNRFDAGDRFQGGAHSNVLQKLKVPFIANELCRQNYTAFNNITSNKQICAGGERGKFAYQI